MPTLIKEMTFDPTHRFYDEALHFCSVRVAEGTSMRLRIATDAGQKMHGALAEVSRGMSPHFSGPAATPTWTTFGTLTLSDVDSELFVKISDCTKIYNFMGGRAYDQPTIDFSLHEYLNGENQNPADQPPTETGTRDWHPQISEKAAALLIGSAFERHHDQIKAKIGAFNFNNRPNWPIELQFFRHMRNGCFHGNQFDIRRLRQGPAIEPNSPPEWRSHVMPDDQSMNGQRVIGMGGFFQDCLTLPFLWDMGEELDKIL